jgi:carbamoyl-phosphate synthase large subunit
MNKLYYNILVTGSGGDIGQSIGKILNKNNNGKLIGCDISSKNAGKFIFKNFLESVRCTSPDYLSFVENLVSKNDIDIIIPVSEPELRFLSQKGILDTIGTAKLICANEEALEIGFDKLKTAIFLQENNLPFPETQNIEDVSELDTFPKIIKSRTGSGSSSVFIANDNQDFQYLKAKHQDFIVQEYLSSDSGEFTCGLFRSKNGEIRTIQLKRELTGGYSGYGEVVDNEQIEDLLHQIANKLNLVGSINVQLRLVDGKPVVFEINPRFSSTVLFRHMFGFNDLIWSIQDKTDQKINAFKKVEAGQKFYKGFSEYID